MVPRTRAPKLLLTIGRALFASHFLKIRFRLLNAHSTRPRLICAVVMEETETLPLHTIQTVAKAASKNSVATACRLPSRCASCHHVSHGARRDDGVQCPEPRAAGARHGLRRRPGRRLLRRWVEPDGDERHLHAAERPRRAPRLPRGLVLRAQREERLAQTKASWCIRACCLLANHKPIAV